MCKSENAAAYGVSVCGGVVRCWVVQIMKLVLCETELKV